jgi:hypothetical protein
MIDDINSSRLEIFEKAVRNVRRNKVIWFYKNHVHKTKWI